MNSMETIEMLGEALEKAKEIINRTGDTKHCFMCEKEPIAHLFKANKYVCIDCLDKLMHYGFSMKWGGAE